MNVRNEIGDCVTTAGEPLTELGPRMWLWRRTTQHLHHQPCGLSHFNAAKDHFSALDRILSTVPETLLSTMGGLLGASTGLAVASSHPPGTSDHWPVHLTFCRPDVDAALPRWTADSVWYAPTCHFGLAAHGVSDQPFRSGLR
eukprot:6476004-Amphidinium_carterae.1